MLQVALSSYYAWRQRRQQLAPACISCARAALPTAALVCAAHHRFRPRPARGAQPLVGSAAPHCPQPGLGGRHHVIAHQGGGWLYLASWQDACSRKVVGWDVRETMPEDLVSEGLRRALAVRRRAAGLDRALGSRQPVHGHALWRLAGHAWLATKHEPPGQLLRQRPGRVLLEPAHDRNARRRQLSWLGSPRLELSYCINYYNAERRHSALA